MDDYLHVVTVQTQSGHTLLFRCRDYLVEQMIKYLLDNVDGFQIDRESIYEICETLLEMRHKLWRSLQ